MVEFDRSNPLNDCPETTETESSSMVRMRMGLTGGLGGGQEYFGRESCFVVGVGIGKIDHPVATHNEDGWNGQEVMGFTGGRLDIDVERCQFFQHGGIDLEGDSESLGRCHGGVAQQGV